jgi:integrase
MGCRVKRAPKSKAGQVRLAFRLIFRGPSGEEVRSWEGTELEATPENERLLKAKAVLIEQDIKDGTFNYLKQFPHGNKASLFVSYKEKTEPKTIRQYYKVWKQDKKPPFIKKTRARNYEVHFNAHILPLQGEKYMHLYGVTEIRELRANIVDVKGRKMKTAKNVVNATLRAFFRDAKAEGIIERNPFDELPEKWWPQTEVPPPDPFTEAERDEIIEYFRKKYLSTWPQAFMFVHDLFWTGARQSELTPRTWRDYDPRTGKFDILTSRTEGEEGATKTRNSNRTIDLLPPVRALFDQLKPLRAKPGDYIYTNRAGQPIDQKEFAERHFWPALRVLKIAHKDFYSTRDTFISVMLSHGERSKKIADYCGTSPTMIEKSYGKWIGDTAKFGAAALSKAQQSAQLSFWSEKTGEKDQDTSANNKELPQVRLVRGAGFEPSRKS